MRVVHMHVRNVMSQSLIVLPRRRVENQEQDVETGEKRGRQVDILDRRDLGVVSTVKRVRRSEDRSTGVQGSRDSGFRDGDRLLLHDLVNRGPVRFLHLVEFVDTTDTVVRQNKSSSLCRYGSGSDSSQKRHR